MSPTDLSVDDLPFAPPPCEVLDLALSPAEYAALIGYRVETVQKLCVAGGIAGAQKVHGRWRIPRRAVPAVCRPESGPQDARDHRRRAKAAAGRLAAM